MDQGAHADVCGSTMDEVKETVKTLLTFDKVNATDTYSPPRFTVEEPFEALRADVESG